MSMKDTDFMSELEAATQLRPASSVTFMLFAIIGFMVFCLVWSGLAKIDELTRGQGRVVPSREVQVVQSLEGGILQEVLVSEGDRVEKGQVLVRLSDVESSSAERGTEARSLGLRAKRARLKAEASGEEFKLAEEILEKAPKIAANEEALYDSRQKELQNAYAILEDRINKATAEISEVNAQVSSLYQNRSLLQQELDLTREMVKKRAVPKLEEIRLQRELGDISGQINSLTQKKKALESELQVAHKEKASQEDRFRSQALSEMNEVETEISSLEESLKTLGDRVYRSELRSPVEGIVNKIALKTIGGVVEAAMGMVEIVPLDDELKIVASVPASDVAFLRPGQDVKVKITAYDPQKYGSLDGKLVRIASNSTSDREGNTFFEIEVRTDKNYLGDVEKPLPISPGMVANIDIITGKRSVLEYLLKPVLRAKDRAFTER